MYGAYYSADILTRHAEALTQDLFVLYFDMPRGPVIVCQEVRSFWKQQDIPQCVVHVTCANYRKFGIAITYRLCTPLRKVLKPTANAKNYTNENYALPEEAPLPA